MMASKKTLAVYVRDDGGVLTEHAHDVRRSYELPNSWLVGIYTRATSCAELEDDLVIRLGELRAAKA